MYYLAEYVAGRGSTYGAQLKARSKKHVRQIMRKRRLGEFLITDGQKERYERGLLPSRVLKSRRATLARKVHALCWLGLVALSSKVAKPADFFDDETGVLHVLAHLAQGDVYLKREEGEIKRYILKRVKAIERKIPGGL